MKLSICLALSLSIFPVFSQQAEPQVANIFVSPDGNDENSGLESAPKASVNGALRTLRALRQEGELTEEFQVNVWLRSGRYRVEETVTLRAGDSGTAEKPFRIAAWPNEKVVFDGREPIERSLFAPAEDSATLERLAETARGEVLVAEIPEGDLHRLLALPESQVSFGSRMLQIARYPDLGFATFAKVQKKDSRIANEVGTREEPKGATVTLNPAVPKEWAAEVKASEKARLSGYITETWAKGSFVIADMDGSNGAITMRDATGYGLPRPHGSRAFLENVLPALDRPGEWFYDVAARKLFLWPPTDLAQDEVIGVWAGTDAFTINGASHVKIENIAFENFGGRPNGSGVLNIRSGTDNLVAGCRIQNVAAPMTAFNITGGVRNRILGCDIFDVANASRLNGGSYNAEGFTAGENTIENCHFTQIYSTDFYGKVCGMGGAGNVFRNNLVHNHNGQIVTIAGVEHLVEKNEVFNTGIEEGDGGAFYQGAMMSSWGNTFRHNFFHHIMCVPKMYTRAAIFSDDGDCGDHVIGNVFYKAGEGFKTNTGSGHLAEDNITIKGIHAFQFLSGRSESRYQRYTGFLEDNPTSSEKENLIGKMLKVIGTEGWEEGAKTENWHHYVSPFWQERYPRMKSLFATWQKEKRIRVLNEVRNNHAFGFGDRNPHAIPEFTKQSGNTSRRSLSIFKDPDKLNFAYKRQRPSWAPDIPFAEIGIYQDPYRPEVSDKDRYREAVAEFWEKETSAPPREYVVKEVNQRSYFNTGKLVLGLLDEE
ncbi:right-handed parallel beta-helix repeat-containing protein [Roseibacillus persicicus]|uniref:hypothetical protein n=1 Tax=Roseibacillus persicicus TaxID=454148 RepID=UPI00398B1A13